MSLSRFQGTGRLGLSVVASAALALGCSSGGSGPTGSTGTIALALSAANASIQQGGSSAVTATLTRGGGFTGDVALNVTGVPTGVTGAVSNVVTSGTTTTATVTISVDASTVPGTYNLTLTGTGTGVTTATAPFALTVTATPAYTLAMTPAAGITIIQNDADQIGVVITRTNYTGAITLALSGAPAGVTGSFAPPAPTGNSSQLTLNVGPAVPVGQYTLTVTGTGASALRGEPGELANITDHSAQFTLTVIANPSFTLSLTSSALSIPQGANAPTTTVNIARTNFSGAVNLAVSGLPANVSAGFSPAAPTGNSSVLTLTVGAAAVPGVYNLSVDATSSAGNSSTPLTLTVTVVGNFSITTNPTPAASVTQGATVDVTINVNRTGGFTNTVTFSVTGLVSGLTINLNPGSTGGNSATLTFSASAGLAVGSYPVVVHANSPGLAEQVANLTVNVAAPAGSGNVTLNFSTCNVFLKAIWVAYQDGTGPWVHVTGTGDVYNFNIAQSKGGYAYVLINASGNPSVTIQYLTQTELTTGTINFCPAPGPTGKTINGTVANLMAGALGSLSMGGAFAFASADGPFQLTPVKDGPQDLVGYMRALAVPAVNDRAYLNRGLNPADLSSVGTVDFTGTNSFVPAFGAASVTGGVGGETTTQSVIFYTGTGANACTPGILYSGSPVSGANFSLYGIPLANEITGDFHGLTLTAVAGGGSPSRTLQEFFTDVVARAATPFALPALLPTPVASDLGGPYKRPQVSVTGVPAEYNLFAAMAYSDRTTIGRAGSITASWGWVGGQNVTLGLPDFSALAGWNNAWVPLTTDSIAWFLSISGWNLVPSCSPGARNVVTTLAGII